MRILSYWRETLAVLGLLLAIGVVVWPGRPVRQEFDPQKWADADSTRTDARVAMAEDLVAKRTLTGKTRYEVIEMLGAPTREFLEPGDNGADGIEYYLGIETTYFTVDSESLRIYFGADERVKDYSIYVD